MAKINLDLTKVQPESTSLFSKVPAGDYLVSVAHSQFKDGRPGAAGLMVGYMVEAGEHKGKMVSDYINIKNDNEKAVEIGLGRLRLICDLQARKSLKLVEDTDLISRSQFMISTVLEESEYQGRATENVKVKKLFKSDDVKHEVAAIKKVQDEVKAEETITTAKMPWE